MNPEDVAHQIDDDLPRCEECGIGITTTGKDCTYSLCKRYDEQTTDDILFLLFENVRPLFVKHGWLEFAELMDWHARAYGTDPLDYHKYLDYFCKTTKQNGYTLTGGIYGPLAFIHADKGDIHGSVDYPVEQGSGSGHPTSPPSILSVRMSSRNCKPWIHSLGFNVNLDDPGWFEDMEAAFMGHKPEKYLLPDERQKRDNSPK